MPGESIEIRARTKDEAIRQALEQLGAERDEVDIEVLEEGRSGVFGVGSQDARVRVTLIGDDLSEEEDEDEPQPVLDAPYARAGEEPDEEYEEEEEEAEAGEPQPRYSDADAETARETLERLLDLLEFPNVVTVSNVEHEGDLTNIHLDVAAEDTGLLIGRRGETLANLQFLLNACLTQQLGRSTRVIVDVEHYRDRREQSLRGIAMRAADRVRREHRPFTLAPMPPNERRIIHLALQESPYVATESTGEGMERRVVISPKGGGPPRRPSYGYRQS
jgi:spoIIIJ-associated protein